MAIARFATDTGTVKNHAKKEPRPPLSLVNTDPPKGARPEDLDEMGIRETLEMLADCEGCDPADLFDVAVQEDGSTWPEEGGYCAAMFGVTAKCDDEKRLPGLWQDAARDAIRAIDAREAMA